MSGHIDLTQAEFDEHYVPRLEEAIARGCRFVVSDAAGCDVMTQEYLFRRGVPCPIYHMFERPRNNYAGIGALRGGYASDEERDAAATQGSDEDIAWVRPGRSKRRSGTARNLARRLEKDLRIRRAARTAWPRVHVVEDHDDFGDLVCFPVEDDRLQHHLLSHSVRRIPVPADFLARYEAAHAAARAVDGELDALWAEAFELGDAEAPGERGPV